MASNRLRELAACGYEAFVQSCGGVDAGNGTLMGGWDRLPSRAQQGWMDGVRAVLGEVYRDQEAAKAAAAASGAVPAPEEDPSGTPVVPMSKSVGRGRRSKEVES